MHRFIIFFMFLFIFSSVELVNFYDDWTEIPTPTDYYGYAISEPVID